MENDLVDDYRKKTVTIQSELQKVQNLFPGTFDNQNKDIGKYFDFVDDPDCQVAIIGAIKAGKSTLMNAILGEDIASTDVTPETAALTIFRHSSKENYVEVHFYTAREWGELWASADKKKDSLFRNKYDELRAEKVKKKYIKHSPIKKILTSIKSLREIVKKYSSSQSPCHFFVKKLVIGLSKWGSESLPLPAHLTFVDTPGLYDVIPYRANITREYIDRANAVVVCVNSSKMTDAEYKTIDETLKSIGYDKGKVVILGTQIDQLNKPNEGWDKQKEHWHKQLETLYGDKELMNTNIIGVSAYIFNMVQKLDTGKQVDGNDIDDIFRFAKKSGIKIQAFRIFGKATNTEAKKLIVKKKDVIMRKTNIGNFLRVLREGPLKEPDMVIEEDIRSWFNDITTGLTETAEDQKGKVENKLKLLREDQKKKQDAINKKSMEIKEIRDARKNIQQQFDTMQAKINTEITGMKKKLNLELKNRIGG